MQRLKGLPPEVANAAARALQFCRRSARGLGVGHMEFMVRSGGNSGSETKHIWVLWTKKNRRPKMGLVFGLPFDQPRCQGVLKKADQVWSG